MRAWELEPERWVRSVGDLHTVPWVVPATRGLVVALVDGCETLLPTAAVWKHAAVRQTQGPTLK